MASQAAQVDIHSLKPSLPPYGEFYNYPPLLRNDIPPPYVGFDLEAYKLLFPQVATRLGVIPSTKDFLEQQGHVYEPDFCTAAAWGDAYWNPSYWHPEDWKRIMEVYAERVNQGRIAFKLKYRVGAKAGSRYDRKGWIWPLGAMAQEIFPAPHRRYGEEVMRRPVLVLLAGGVFQTTTEIAKVLDFSIPCGFPLRTLEIIAPPTRDANGRVRKGQYVPACEVSREDLQRLFDWGVSQVESGDRLWFNEVKVSDANKWDAHKASKSGRCRRMALLIQPLEAHKNCAEILYRCTVCGQGMAGRRLCATDEPVAVISESLDERRSRLSSDPSAASGSLSTHKIIR